MTEPSAVVAAEQSVPQVSNNQKGCASFGWLHLLVGAIVLLRHAALGAGDEGTGALQITDFDEIGNTLTTECDPGWMESLQVDHGDWIDGIRVYCSDEPTSIKFVIGKANDVYEKNVCEGSGGIASITGHTYFSYLSGMTFTCKDGTEFGTYGSQYDDDSVVMTTSCDSSYQYATGFKYYQPCDLITECDAVSCSEGCDFQYLQLMCSNVSNFISESDDETESEVSPVVLDAAWEIAVTVIGTVIAATITGVFAYLCTKRRCNKEGKVQELSYPVQ